MTARVQFLAAFGLAVAAHGVLLGAVAPGLSGSDRTAATAPTGSVLAAAPEIAEVVKLWDTLPRVSDVDTEFSSPDPDQPRLAPARLTVRPDPLDVEPVQPVLPHQDAAPSGVDVTAPLSPNPMAKVVTSAPTLFAEQVVQTQLTSAATHPFDMSDLVEPEKLARPGAVEALPVADRVPPARWQRPTAATPRPKARPLAAQTTQAVVASAVRVAPSSSGGPVQSQSPKPNARQIQQWGASILARIERSKRFPAGLDGQQGRVGLRLVVTQEGQLASVSVTRSSGVAGFDQAAVRAVRAVRRFERAPTPLAKGQQDFNMTMRFDG